MMSPSPDLRRWNRFVLFAIVALSAFALSAPIVHAANTWDGDGNTNWWFDPANWSREEPTPACPCLPPSQSSDGTTVFATDAQINPGTGAWDITAEGVVFDPDNDPFFASAAGLNYPTGSSATPFVGSDYGPEHLHRLYISRNTTNTNLLTIKSGNMVLASTTIVGRSGSTSTDQNLGHVRQLGGSVNLPLISMEVGHSETSGWGNGMYEYHAGTLEISLEGGSGLRLAHGTDSGQGAGGTALFVIHNPSSGGHLRVWDYTHVSYRGQADGMVTSFDPDGITRGVATSEFHYENGGTRPVQVARHLTLNNGVEPDTLGTMSSRLDLVLGESPIVDVSGVPNDLGLFDVDFDIGFGSNDGTVRGFGDIDNDTFTDAVFANADGSEFYLEGDTVSAQFGSTRFDWTISYTGNIDWSDEDNSVISLIGGPGTGTDVVLMGLGSEMIVAGDFNNDGNWDCADINMLTAAIAAGSTDLQFDMNGDGSLTTGDVTDSGNGWLAVGGQNNPDQTGGNPFLVGDANLDGIVDGLDFIDWNANKFTSDTNWCDGNFNADSVVDGLDFIDWNTNKFSSSSPDAVVPEPATSVLLVFVAVVVGLGRRES